MTAKFIVVEGIDGAGTTTQTKLIKEALHELGKKVFTTCEPSEGIIGQFLRKTLTEKSTPLDAMELALLFTADRLEHVREVLKPALVDYDYIICDRYYHSTLAYQLKSEAKNLDWLITINEPALRPALTFFLDVKLETALTRMNQANREQELFETQKQLKRVYHNYHLIVDYLRKKGEVIIILDGEASFELILEAELKTLAAI